MMPVAVVTVDAAMLRAARSLMSDVAAFDTVTTGGRSHLLYRVSGRSRDVSFLDPIDGEMLVELNYFDSEPEARAWVASDTALRAARTGSVQ